MESNLTAFLSLYFYLLEIDLNSSVNELNMVKFQSEEANTDEYLKKYFQKYILENNKINETNIKSVCLNNDKSSDVTDINELMCYEISNVYLPNQLSATQKKEISKLKEGQYTNPDLYLEITDGNNLHFESLELKSTKNNTIPGSSVQQVLPFEWVIFVKRSKDNVSVTTGHYINSITEKLPFPDRSPRPLIGFNTLKDWNKQNRIEIDKELSIYVDEDLINTKLNLLKDWQDFLADEWLSIIKAKTIKPKEKWFNNALRKFTKKLLEYTQTLNDEQTSKLISDIESLTNETNPKSKSDDSLTLF